MLQLELNGVVQRYGRHTVVDGVDFRLATGQIACLLGPSGCGKTTLLRCIAGLEDPDEGEISIGYTLVYSRRQGISLPAGKRGLGLVFQNYALWPHMKVRQNLTFALEIQKLPKPEMDQRVTEALAEMQMSDYADRYPREMSGGQQQRIALARMLAYRPHVFLMDEPLSNLDARLRMDMRVELKRLHQSSGATTIYVTHDQVEALTMSTRIAVMKEGVLQQVDVPERVYHFPANLFVADFIGNPKVNLLNGTVTQRDMVDLGEIRINAATRAASGEVVLGVRPEDVAILDHPVDGAEAFSAWSVLPSGSETIVLAKRGALEITIKVMGSSPLRMGQEIWLKFDSGLLNVYDKATGMLITAER